jgi:hypothetical protein
MPRIRISEGVLVSKVEGHLALMLRVESYGRDHTMGFKNA